MATPNYAYEKRQKELAKKRKQEEKRQKKSQRGPGESGDAPPADGEQATDAAPAPPPQE